MMMVYASNGLTGGTDGTSVSVMDRLGGR